MLIFISVIDVSKQLDEGAEMVKQGLDQKWAHFGQKTDVGSSEARVESVGR